MTNTKKLRAALVEKGLTYSEVAKMLNISCQTLCKKINNQVDFRVPEMKKLMEILELTNYEEIFFCEQSRI